uniref:NADH dehydrogenase subunit 5 n=1 Tax=Ayyaria chaetophora TaxID=1291247 RepID=UPI0030E45B38
MYSIFSFFFFLFFLFFMVLFYFFISLKFSVFLHWEMYCFPFDLSFPIFLDYKSSLFISLVFLISGSIVLYCQDYMVNEMNNFRFFLILSFFVLSMVFLILSPNLFSMMLGWDGLGLTSYGLVIFYQNKKSFNSGFITVMTNRVGDVLILGSLSIFFFFGSWSYMNLFPWFSYLLCILFILASMTKSAQIPFSAWLPAAMAAPTPVSSLVHSSTLVTAGVYILIRFSSFIEIRLKLIFILFSLLTMIMSGFSAFLEVDFKKIIAFSTLSQLGIMMSSIFLGFSDLAFFHLLSHASFKALMFMCSGFFIHSFKSVQDIRKLGYMSESYFFAVCCFSVCNLSLCGFPFLSGFYSKDLILEMVIFNNLSFVYVFLFFLGTFLTVLYSFRLLFKVLNCSVMYFSPLSLFFNFSSVSFSFFFLFLFSIFFGFLGSKMLIFPYNFVVFPLKLKVSVLLMCFFALLIFFFSIGILKLSGKLLNFLTLMWFLHFFLTDFLKKSFFFFIWKMFFVFSSLIELYLGLKLINQGLLFGFVYKFNFPVMSVYSFFLVNLMFIFLFTWS